MTRIVRNMSTPEARAFWAKVGEAAEEVRSWPEWRRVSALRAVRGTLVSQEDVEELLEAGNDNTLSHPKDV